MNLKVTFESVIGGFAGAGLLILISFFLPNQNGDTSKMMDINVQLKMSEEKERETCFIPYLSKPYSSDSSEVPVVPGEALSPEGTIIDPKGGLKIVPDIAPLQIPGLHPHRNRSQKLQKKKKTADTDQYLLRRQHTHGGVLAFSCFKRNIFPYICHSSPKN